jgi:hypothetical protein
MRRFAEPSERLDFYEIAQRSSRSSIQPDSNTLGRRAKVGPQIA